MARNSVLESIEVEQLINQLRLLNSIQSENLEGSWERAENEDRYFWSDSMFALHGLPVHPRNYISIEEASNLIHSDDLRLVQENRQSLEQTGHAEFIFRIGMPDGNIRRIHAKERKFIIQGKTVYQGYWQDEKRTKENQQPVIDINEKQAVRLKVFERAEEVAQAGSWQINLDTYETIYSDNVYRIHGLQPQSIAPHIDSFRRFIHPDDRQVVLKTMEKSYVEMIPLHLEYRIVREDGEVRYINQVSHILKNSKGEHILSGSTSDITEQKLLELQLRETNEILSLHNELFVQAEQIGHLGTWQINLNTRKSVYSSNLYRLYGVKPLSLMAGLQNFMQFIHPDDREMVQSAHTRAFDEHVSPDMEFRIIRSDGKHRIFRQKCRFLKSEGDELLIGIIQDVTSQQQKDRLITETSAKLAVQNEAFRQAEKVAGMGSWTWNLDTNELTFTDNVFSIYGLKPQTAVQGMELFEKYAHPDDRQLIKATYEKIRDCCEPLIIDHRIIRADGELRHLRSKHQPIVSPDGHSLIIGNIQDVTGEVVMRHELLERIQFSETLSDSMVDRIIVTDNSNNIIGWNKSCEKFYGIKKSEAIGRNYFDVLQHEKIPEVITRFKNALNGEVTHVPEMATTHRQGFQELFMIPFKNETGVIQGILHVLHDTTMQQQLQQQLTDRLHFIEKLLEASVDQIMVLDNDLCFRLWNGQCEKYNGRSRDQVIGKHVLEIFPQYKTGTIYQHCVKALDGEITHVPPDEKLGLAGYHESYFIPLKNEVKETTGILWIIHDLSERFIAEKAYSKQQELLRQAEKIAHLGSWELELETDRLYWSDGIFTIYGYAPQVFEPTMEFYLETTHPEDREELMSAISRAKTGYIPKALNCRIYTVDGEMRHIITMIRPVIDEDGNASRLIAAIQDNTDQKIMQDELIRKTTAIRLQYHMDRQSEKIRNFASWQWNLNTGKMIWGEHFFRILGIEPFSFDPTLEAFSELMIEEDGNKFRELCKQIASDPSGKSIQYEFRLTTNGKTRYLRLSGRIVSASHAIGTVIDITEDNLLRQQLAVRLQAIENLNRSLEDKNRKLEEINEELTSFAFVASHDLREPLRKIQVFSDWLSNNESERLTQEGLDKFKRIQLAVHRMDVLIDDILRYSRVNTPFSGFIKLDLDAILENIKGDLADLIESTKTIIESDPLPVVTGNETQLSQLFMNILSNAIKYQAPGNIPHIRISSAIKQGTAIDHPAAFHALNYVRISFADNGIGFDEQYSRKIFQMFQRLHGMSEYPGTGMGLAICKKIAEHHRGFIVASSKPGQGSVFDFYIPDTANE